MNGDCGRERRALLEPAGRRDALRSPYVPARCCPSLPRPRLCRGEQLRGRRARAGGRTLLRGGRGRRRGTARAAESPQGVCGHLPTDLRPAPPLPSDLRLFPAHAREGRGAGLLGGRPARWSPGVGGELTPNGAGGVGS